VIGCLIQQPSLLDMYSLSPDDFDGEDFHQIIFACIYNLYNQGVNVIDCFAIDSFIANYEKQYKIFSDNNGIDYINEATVMCEPNNFEYNFNRLKKFSLLRYYESQGFDTRGIYNPSIVEPVKQETEQKKFDSFTVEQIIDTVEIAFVSNPKSKFQSAAKPTGELAGVGMLDLIEKYRQTPEMGFPMQSKFMNFLLRGSRRRTFYLRSGGTGSGKSRLSFADTCCAAVPWIYDLDKNEWVYTGFCVPSLIISTELELDEVRSIVLAFVSGVNESHVLDNEYEEGEYERVIQAAKYLESSPLYLEYLPDFDMTDVENMIKRYHREKNIQLVNFDYLQTSIKLMIQMTSLSKGMKLREDQVLFMFSDCLKTCSTSLNINVNSDKQLNSKYK